MKHFVVGIDWYGPYSRKEAIKDAAEYNPRGLYMALGRLNRETVSKPQYVGLSTSLSNRLRNHANLEWIEANGTIDQIWLGYAATAEQSGRRSKSTPRTIDDAEWCHIYFMRPPVNTNRVLNPPQQNVTVLNRWWHADGRPRMRRPNSQWPDLFDYMGLERRSRVVWFGGRVEAYDLHHKDLTTTD
jgi:hypothetical protein